MKNNCLIILLLLLSNYVKSQVVPYPVPRCENIQRVGNQQENGFSTHYWVNEYSIDGDDCDGVSIQVSGAMNTGDYAYAIININQFTQSSPDEVDFSIDLTKVFNRLPTGADVTIVHLNNGKSIIGELLLRKYIEPSTAQGKQLSMQIRWMVKIKWYNVRLTEFTEEFFTFDEDGEVLFNYIWDDSNPKLPVSAVSLGNDMISVNPYTNSNSVITANENGTGKVVNINLGIIDTDILLVDGDQIKFELSLIQDDLM